MQYLSRCPAVEKVASGHIAVRDVRNEIGVEPADVKLLVSRALDRSALVPDDSDVQVDISGSTVILPRPGEAACRGGGGLSALTVLVALTYQGIAGYDGPGGSTTMGLVYPVR
jgi:hypothetical protein